MRRRAPVGTMRSSLLALLGALAITVALLGIGSESWGRALEAFFFQPVANAYYFGNMVGTMGYLLLASLGIVVAFRGGLYNLGGEGQIFVGALAGTLAALALPGLPGFAGVFLLLVVGAATGALLAGVSGLLRRVFGAPELITSYLLSAALIPVSEYLISGPANDPDRNLLATATIDPAYWLARLLPPSELNLAFPLAIAMAALVHLAMFHTVRGYEVRLYGLNREFAVYAGINETACTVGPMTLSGALHGLTGALMIAGTYHATISGFTGGIGWNAIAVALVARLHPVGAIASALVFAYLDAGSKASMLHTEFTFELGTIIQAVILMLVTASFALRRRSRRDDDVADGVNDGGDP
ncbi:MAG: ABC transporter permease [Spirochaetota bacterium]